MMRLRILSLVEKMLKSYIPPFSITLEPKLERAVETLDTIRYIIDANMELMFMDGQCKLTYKTLNTLEDVLDFMFKNPNMVFLNISQSCIGRYKLYYYEPSYVNDDGLRKYIHLRDSRRVDDVETPVVLSNTIKFGNRFN